MASLSVAELGILNWIQANCHNEFWDEVMPVLTSLGNGGLIWIALAVAILLLQRGKRGTGLQVLIALLLSLVLCNLLLKNAVDRVRPFDLNQMVQLLVPEPQEPLLPLGTYLGLLRCGDSSLPQSMEGTVACLGPGRRHWIFPDVPLPALPDRRVGWCGDWSVLRVAGGHPLAEMDLPPLAGNTPGPTKDEKTHRDVMARCVFSQEMV